MGKIITYSWLDIIQKPALPLTSILVMQICAVWPQHSDILQNDPDFSCWVCTDCLSWHCKQCSLSPVSHSGHCQVSLLLTEVFHQYTCQRLLQRVWSSIILSYTHDEQRPFFSQAGWSAAFYYRGQRWHLEAYMSQQLFKSWTLIL